MVAVTISDSGLRASIASLEAAGTFLNSVDKMVVELRADLAGLGPDEIVSFISRSHLPVIVSGLSDFNSIANAIGAGAAYIDIDLALFESLDESHRKILAGYHDVNLIVSVHFNGCAPSYTELISVYQRCVSTGASIVKLVSVAACEQEAEMMLHLYSDSCRKGEESVNTPSLISFAMGEEFRYTRAASLTLGAPFTYCALSPEGKVAPGMLLLDEYVALISRLSSIKGEVAVPPSKSIAQRAIIAAVMAKGESLFTNFGHCDDIDMAVAVAKELAQNVSVEGDTLRITGSAGGTTKQPDTNPFAGLMNVMPMMGGEKTIFVGESGLLSRLCLPVLAQLGESFTVTGDGSLMDRRMYGCKEVMEQLGATCVLTDKETLPAAVSGPLKGGNITFSGAKGSQLISGLLMALPACRKPSVMRVENPSSIPYILLTIEVLKEFGIVIDYEREKDAMIFNIPARQKYRPANIIFEGDWSSAANFVVLGAIFGETVIKGLRGSSIQADRMVVDVVRRCGASAEYLKGKLRVRRGYLRSFDFDVTNCPDLLPPLSVLALFSEGTTTIKGVARLNNKESNRPLVMTKIMKDMGEKAYLSEDGEILTIEGASLERRVLENRLPKGGNFSSSGDHRVAMALKILSVGCSSEVVIDTVDCINKSFPAFLSQFSNICSSK